MRVGTRKQSRPARSGSRKAHGETTYQPGRRRFVVANPIAGSENLGRRKRSRGVRWTIRGYGRCAGAVARYASAHVGGIG
jgi:hypothetical protein